MTQTSSAHAGRPEEIPNPFELPPVLGQSLRALRPWHDREHEAYYLPVDRAEEGYRSFVNHLPDPSTHLTRFGQLVVVAGPTGCGRTSLIHRCVHHLKQEFDGASGGRIMAAPVADLSRERAFDLEMVGRRGDFDQYLALLAYKIRSRLSRQLEGLSDPGDQPMQGKVAFTRLGRDLEDADAVAIIVLPQFNDATWKRSMLSLQAMHPINHYLDLVGERMILFAESDNPQQIKDWSDRVRGEAREGVLVIEVGMLTGTDGWTFANGRLQMCDHPRVPTVTAETMHAVMEDHRSMSLKQLQKMCFHLWDEARRRPGAKEVSKHDFDRYYVDRRDGYRPRGRGTRNG